MLPSSLMPKSAGLVVATVLSLAVPPAAAQQPAPDGRGPPGEGRPPRIRMPEISLRDIESAAREMFQQADVDGDGTATPAELDQIEQDRRDQVIRTRFAEMDRNGDQSIDFAEFSTWQEDLGARVHEDRGSRTYEMTIVPDAVPIPRGKDDGSELFDILLAPVSRMTLIKANTNYDEGVDFTEFLAFQRRAFDAADGDRNGRLQGDEIRRLIESRRPERSCVVAGQPPAAAVGPEAAPRSGSSEPECGKR